jgi:DNA repair protein RadD
VADQFIPRPYQKAADESAEAFRRQNKYQNGILIEPTGSGKSHIIASIVEKLDAPCLVFQPSKEILEQNYAKMVSYGYTPEIYSASMRKKNVGEITLATIGSVVGKPEIFSDVEYVIVDECHAINPRDGMYSDFLRNLGDIRVIGLTATPFRLTTDAGGSILKFLTRTRPRVFNSVIHYTQIEELVRQGYWAKLEYKNWNAIDRSKLKLNQTGSEYTDRSVRRQIQEDRFEDKLEKVVNRLMSIGRKSILVFTRFVEESQYLARKIPGVEIVTAETPRLERERVINGFKSGVIRVVTNCAVLGIGFDFPELDTVVLAAPTASLGRYYQEVGRAVRPHPNKQSALIVDMVGLVDQFGKVEDLVLDPGKNGKWEIRTHGRPLTGVYFGDVKEKQFWIEKALEKKLGPIYGQPDGERSTELIAGLSRIEKETVAGALNAMYFGGVDTVHPGSLKYIRLPILGQVISHLRR